MRKSPPDSGPTRTCSTGSVLVAEFAQWPQQGCTLDETCGRLACLPASAENDRGGFDPLYLDEVMAALAQGQFVGYGTKQASIEREIISRGFWSSKPKTDWQR